MLNGLGLIWLQGWLFCFVFFFKLQKNNMSVCQSQARGMEDVIDEPIKERSN